MKKYLFLALAMFISLFSISQEVIISNTTLNTCTGFIVDTGGGISTYGPDEEFTMVLCSDGDTIMNLMFTLFNLGSGDFLSIYDGGDVSAPLIGTYGGNDLSLQNVTSTNPSGCLTLYWTSDAVDVGDFSAEISCGIPCIPPIVSATTNGGDTTYTVRSCPGEEVTFDASGTIFGNSLPMTGYEWDFSDGTIDNSSGLMVSHVFNEPGGYPISFEVTVDNDCVNTNSIDILVLVSTYPEFSSPDIASYCLGEIESLSGDEFETLINSELIDYTIDPVPYEISFGGLDGEGFHIPDGVGACYSNTIEVSGFAPGSTITSIDMIENLFVNMEHTWLGDLTITYICPNNQSIAVQQAGGGNTDLGNPLNGLNSPGTGFDYWWAPDAPNNTWTQVAAGVNTIPSGIYSSVQSFNSLLGCPLNGNWTIQICDGAFQDDGYVFDWGIAFDPSLYPDYVGFEPIYGQDCDSTYFSSDYFTQEPDCSLTWSQYYTESGEYPITVTTTNDFGCSFDNELTITVVDNPVGDAGELQYYCEDEDQIQLDASVLSITASLGAHTWAWEPGPFLPNDQLGSYTPTLEPGATGNLWYYYTVTPVDHPACAHTDSVNIVINPVSDISILLTGDSIICANSVVDLSIDDAYVNYEWNGDNSLNSNSIEVGPGSYTVVAYVDEDCPVTADIIIYTLPEVDFEDQDICELEVLINDEDDIVLDGTWSFTSGGSGALIFNTAESSTLITADQIGEYTLTFVDECGIEDMFDISFNTAPTEELFTVSNFVICNSEFPIDINPLGDNADDYDWEWSTLSTETTISVSDLGEYTYTVSNECGFDQDTVSVELYPEVDFSDQQICDDLDILISDIDNNISGEWSYTTIDGGELSFDQPQSTAAVTATTSGEYQITFTDDCGMSDSFVLVVGSSPSEEQFTIESGYTVCDSDFPLTLEPQGVDSDSYDWAWSNSATTTNTNVDGVGTYYVTVSNDCGSDQDTVTVELSPEVDFVDHSVCNSLQISVNDNDNNVNGSWSYISTNGETLSFSNSSNSSSIVSATDEGIYLVTFTDDCNRSDEFEVTMTYAPNESDFSIEPIYITCLEEMPQVLAPQSNNVNYSWSWNTEETTSSIEVVENGIYSYEVSNNCGTVTGYTEISFISCVLIIPNVFTPDHGDEFNDNFVIVGLESFPGSQLTIVNRWGNTIYESSDYKNDWSPAADEVADGTYFYYLHLNTISNIEEDYSGYLQILR